MSNEVKCPYCGFENEHDGESYKQDGGYEWQCQKCKKKFIMNPQHDVYFSTEKADCLNDGNHNYQREFGFPEEWMRTRCIMCDKQLPGEKLPHLKEGSNE